MNGWTRSHHISPAPYMSGRTACAFPCEWLCCPRGTIRTANHRARVTNASETPVEAAAISPTAYWLASSTSTSPLMTFSNDSKNIFESFFAVLVIRRPPSCASLPPVSAFAV